MLHALPVSVIVQFVYGDRTPNRRVDLCETDRGRFHHSEFRSEPAEFRTGLHTRGDGKHRQLLSDSRTLDRATAWRGPGRSRGRALAPIPESVDLPSEIQNLRWPSDKVILVWDSIAAEAGPGTGYEVLRGYLTEFPVGSGPSEVCLDSPTAATVDDSETPVTETGFYYLVRGANICGISSYGTTSSGSLRTSASCP